MFWEILKKAIVAHIAMIRLERAKMNSWRKRIGLRPKYPIWDEVVWWWGGICRELLVRGICPCFFLFKNRQTEEEIKEELAKQEAEKRKAERKKRKNPPLWRVKGTWHNQIVMALFGFACGAVATLAIYFFMVFQLTYNPFTATMFCLCVGPFLTIGLAFSEEFRLMGILIFPYMFAGRGRAMLLSFCLVLAVNGPGKSIIFNAEVLNDSLACYYNVLVNVICDVIKQGLNGVMSVVQAIVNMATQMMCIYKKIMKVFAQIKNAMMDIGVAIKSAFTWLQAIEGVCDEKYGGPMQRCEKTFNDATDNCMATLGLGALNYHLCSIVDWFKGICMFARIIEYLCQPARGARKGSVDDARSYMYQASGKYHSFFLFGLELYSDFDMKVNMSKSLKQIRKEIFDEVVDRGGWVFFIMDAFSWSCVVYILLILAKAVMYRYRYVTDDGYDNHYLSVLIKRVDDKREQMEKPTVLPLKTREMRRYIDPMSLALTRTEIRELTRVAVNLIATGFQIGYLMFVDTSLYFIMETIRSNGYVKTNFKRRTPAKAVVQGDGFMADAIRSTFTHMPQSFSSNIPEIDTTECVPYGWPPNHDRYRQIIVFYLMVLVFGLAQPLALRLRHIACGWYYPERARKRALWLYNAILKRRGGFISFVQRTLRRKQLVDPNMDVVGRILERLAISIPCLRVMLTYLGMVRVYCGVCSESYDPEADEGAFRRCDNYGCEGVYCHECFSDMNNRCTICLKPVDYGDISDISEEVDSSSDEELIKKREERLLMKELGLPPLEEDEKEDEDLEYDYQEDPDQADGWDSDQERWQNRRKARRDVENQNKDGGATMDMLESEEESDDEEADEVIDTFHPDELNDADDEEEEEGEDEEDDEVAKLLPLPKNKASAAAANLISTAV
ncbi:DC-STAMP domain-containing protein 2-like [Amphibalanus amphitrite]|uniref:DC-STAMP domain-containing protein 2-like n=1 Tax=Amphibalanus amphitrite TaxID=1232801 RepID=UPI001C90FF2C|nr:DC-STAMP domain-containing protein 2-like [Amphibalanus amphitrite]